jgi:rubredoxin
MARRAMRRQRVRTSFEGTFLGGANKLVPGTRLDSGVRWQVYDPALGDPIAQIPPGTPFPGLPDHWGCPHCDSAPDRFMGIDHDA